MKTHLNKDGPVLDVHVLEELALVLGELDGVALQLHVLTPLRVRVGQQQAPQTNRENVRVRN